MWPNVALSLQSVPINFLSWVYVHFEVSWFPAGPLIDMWTQSAIVKSGRVRWGFSSVQFSHSVVSDSLRPHKSQHARPPCPSSTPGVYSNSCPLSQWWGEGNKGKKDRRKGVHTQNLYLFSDMIQEFIGSHSREPSLAGKYFCGTLCRPTQQYYYRKVLAGLAGQAAILILGR